MKVEIKGLRELERKLKELPHKLARKALRRAISQAGILIRDEMRLRAPVESGELRRSIRVSIRFRPSEKAVEAKVGPGKDQRHIAGFNEFGTARQPGRPFLRPAFDSKWRAAQEKLREELARGLREVAKS